MTKSLQDIQDQYTTITIKQDEDGFYISPHTYGDVTIHPNQGITISNYLHTPQRIQTAIETLQEVLEFKLKYP